MTDLSLEVVSTKSGEVLSVTKVPEGLDFVQRIELATKAGSLVQQALVASGHPDRAMGLAIGVDFINGDPKPIKWRSQE